MMNTEASVLLPGTLHMGAGRAHPLDIVVEETESTVAFDVQEPAHLAAHPRCRRRSALATMTLGLAAAARRSNMPIAERVRDARHFSLAGGGPLRAAAQARARRQAAGDDRHRLPGRGEDNAGAPVPGVP